MCTDRKYNHLCVCTVWHVLSLANNNLIKETNKRREQEDTQTLTNIRSIIDKQKKLGWCMLSDFLISQRVLGQQF